MAMINLKEAASRFDFEKVTPKANDWVQATVDYKGRGTAELGYPKATVAGPFTARFDEEGASQTETVFDNIFPHDPDYDGPPIALLCGATKTQSGWGFGEMNNPCESLSFETDQGMFMSTGKIDWAGMNWGTQPTRLRFAVREGKLETKNTAPAKFFAVPLVNCVAELSNYLSGDHPLRIYPTPALPEGVPEDLKSLARMTANQKNSVLGFSVEGNLFFIERLSDYDARAASLRSGAARRKITAVLVGEVGANPTGTLAEFRSWFPFDILSALSFASGSEVGFPWIEIRDEEGALIRRLHGGARMPSFFEGDDVFGKFSRPGAGEFITRFMALPRDRRRLLRVVMNHARLGSLGPHLFLYDIVDHLVRALDALCRGHGLMQQNLCAGLTTAAQDAVKNITADTTSRLRQLADGASQAGNLSDYRLLKRIEGRAANMGNSENMLGFAAVDLLRKWGFPDVQIIDNFLVQAGRPDWAHLISAYRNDTLHEGHLDFENKHDAAEVVRVCAHLKDALTRCLLKECGYSGTYESVLRSSYGPQNVDWVTPTTDSKTLGF